MTVSRVHSWKLKDAPVPESIKVLKNDGDVSEDTGLGSKALGIN